MAARSSTLTVRGRAFVAAGATAVVCAILLDQRSLARIGVLVAALALVAVLVVRRSRYQLALTRTVEPQLVGAGATSQVHLELVNEGRRRTGLMLLEDTLPFVLGSHPRFVLPSVRPGERRTVTYQIRSDVRGRFPVGPMTVRLRDPFGLVEVVRAFHATVPVTVTPRTIDLPAVPIAGAWTGSGDNRPRAFATGSAEDVTVREYRHGDDLRRVHWRSSARSGELMVRREEQPWQSRATIFLDNRSSAHQGRGAASSLETAVSMAASVAVHLAQRGFIVRLVTAEGEDPSIPWHERSTSANVLPLLEALAVVNLSHQAHLDTSWMGDSSRTGMLVGILGAMDDHDHEALRRMRLNGSNPMAVALDVGRWGTGRGQQLAQAGDAAATRLAGLGWRVVVAGPEDRLPRLWEDLAQRRTTAPKAGTP
ncbi:DUF58 domain-containing protein [Nocardioides sp. AE5]|uniref:DUF58 domain-containing protein n=1 Tax=Nocardioides sp. AE5 TaxID=2962573 RepID=UPI002880FB2E|nr:DUF58 domain-containing protein [Nocardioides sp. AE5]MDT0201245.1 DUF58 domain-containing protein [Nocardioides sp. AE5]